VEFIRLRIRGHLVTGQAREIVPLDCIETEAFVSGTRTRKGEMRSARRDEDGVPRATGGLNVFIDWCSISHGNSTTNPVSRAAARGSRSRRWPNRSA
jgi:hypothetical protein